jgi:hypothetical protein
MVKLLAVLILICVALLLIRPVRERLAEEIKDLSDRLLLRLLHMTSGFEGELTPDGKEEQKLWRAQRLRNLRGLSLRSRQRFDKSKPAA